VGWNNRWTVVAVIVIGQFPGGQPGSGSPAAIVAAEVDQRELRPGRREVERAAVIDANGADVRASTFSKDAEPATRALTTEVPVPSHPDSLKARS